jgi:cytochrome c oxidase subunit II
MVVLMKHDILRIVALVTAVAAVATTPSFTAPSQDEVKVINVTAERFSFTPSEIRVRAGTRLEIRLRSDDTAHGFRIIGTDVDIELPKRGRGVASVMFQPKAGRYTFECSKLCGAGHSFMRGVIIATD